MGSITTWNLQILRLNHHLDPYSWYAERVTVYDIYNIYYHIYYILNFGLPVSNLKYGFRSARNRDPLFGTCSNKTRLLKKTCSLLFKCENSSHFPLLPAGYPMVTRG